MSSPTRTVLLTGARGIGKTTACLRLRSRALAAGMSCGGFLTIPVHDREGRRLGLDLLDATTGNRRRLASCRHDLGGPRVGPYRMKAETFEWGLQQARSALDRTALLFFDEIGPLELEHDQGFAPLRELLAARTASALVVVVRPSLVEAIAAGWDLTGAGRFEVTTSDRDAAPASLLARLFPELSSGRPPGVA